MSIVNITQAEEVEKVYEFEDEITPAVISRAMDNYY